MARPPRLGEYFFYSAEMPRSTDQYRPQIQLFARAITESMVYGVRPAANFRNYRNDEEPNAAWSGTGKGVSGETGN